MDEDLCYTAIRGKDARFDGWFFVAVTSTGIYCRPSCPAVTPKRENVRFYPTAAAAQAAGFRACKRCRPDAAPGSPEWNLRADVVGRAMRLIADGIVDRDGVGGLAGRLGYSERHLHRLLLAEVGAGPLALARAQRAHTARTLLETTPLPVSDVAFGAGFASIRQFNDTVREVFALTPTQLRDRAGGRAAAPAPPGVITVRLSYREPMDADGLFRFLGLRAVPGVEEATGDTYRRVLDLPHGLGVAELSADPRKPFVWCRLRLHDLRDLTAATQRCRRLLDLDADPAAADEALCRSGFLAPLVAKTPGKRLPGSVEPVELAVRAVLGQQVSVAAARTLAARLAARYGAPLEHPDGGLTHAFPRADALAAADPADLAMPASRRRAVLGLAAAIADGAIALDPGADRDEVDARLRALPGIGPWTSGYIRMRGLGDPDVFLPTDLGIRRALKYLDADPDAAADPSSAWRPWRSYALQHLWAVPVQRERTARRRAVGDEAA